MTLFFFGVSSAMAITTNLWFMAINKLAGARIHLMEENEDRQVPRRLLLLQLHQDFFFKRIIG